MGLGPANAGFGGFLKSGLPGNCGAFLASKGLGPLPAGRFGANGGLPNLLILLINKLLSDMDFYASLSFFRDASIDNSS